MYCSLHRGDDDPGLMRQNIMFPERFSNLPVYPFQRLRALLDAYSPGGKAIHMSLGEPGHPFPSWVVDIIAENSEGFGNYPVNEGTPELLNAARDWLEWRYGVALEAADNFIALNGTREGLYNVMAALCPEEKSGKRPVVLIPNPFYQVYLVAALSVGAKPVFLPATRETGYLPDFGAVPEEILNQTAVVYMCSPSNPQGAVATIEYWTELLGLAEKYDFRIFADECYSEIYRDEQPVGALQAASKMNIDPERVVVFHSLSKRSNLPGLRSGFAAGGSQSVKRMRQLRAYGGSPLPMPLQKAAAKIWAEESHVIRNREHYREKYSMADEVLGDVPGYREPQAGFFLWLPVPNGVAAALKLWRETGVRVLPGEYLSQDVEGLNPGEGYIRVAMVAPKDELANGLVKIKGCLFK